MSILQFRILGIVALFGLGYFLYHVYGCGVYPSQMLFSCEPFLIR